jgi:hypothetical protein
MCNCAKSPAGMKILPRFSPHHRVFKVREFFSEPQLAVPGKSFEFQAEKSAVESASPSPFPDNRSIPRTRNRRVPFDCFPP